MAKKLHAGVTDQTKASKHRLDDARRILDKAKRWRAAMYIGGYSVECLIKSRLMRQFGCDNLIQLEDELHNRKLLKSELSMFTHSLELLLQLAGAIDRLRNNKQLWPHFVRVNRWIPAWRYSPDLGSKVDAEDFIESVEKVHHWIEVNT